MSRPSWPSAPRISVVSSKPFVPTGVGNGAVEILVNGPTGCSVSASTPLAKMSFGPWPRIFAAIGPPKNAASRRTMMKTPRHDGDLVLPEAAPDLLPVAARLDLDTAGVAVAREC